MNLELKWVDLLFTSECNLHFFKPKNQTVNVNFTYIYNDSL